ncbi:MAG: hypothetical protein R3F37_21955 [Candidatus Competibacteraceae bacterium]
MAGQTLRFLDEIPAIDLLAGDDRLRLALDAGADLSDLIEQWLQERVIFEMIRQEALLY